MNSPIRFDWLYRRKHSLVIILLVCLVAVMRVPTTPRMVFRDSYASASLVDAILSSESLRSPDVDLSVKGDFMHFGYTFAPIYPLTIVSFMQLTGADIEQASVLASIGLGVLGFLASFVLAREFLGDGMPAYLAALSYATAPIFVSQTTHTLLSRGLFTAILPLLIWLLLKHARDGEARFLGASFCLAVALYLTHRMGVLIPIYYIAYALSALMHTYQDNHRPQGRAAKLTPLLYSALAILLVLWSLESMTVIPQFRQNYSTGALASGTSLRIRFINLIIDYLSNAGVLSLFAVIGLAAIIWETRRYTTPRNDILLVAALTLILPLSSAGQYAVLLFLPIISLLSAKGLTILLEGTPRFTAQRNASAAACFLITTSIIFTLFMAWHWLTVESRHHMTESNWIDERVISALEYSEALNASVIAPKFPDLMAEASYVRPKGTSFKFSWLTYGFRFIQADANETVYVLESESFPGKFYGPYDNIMDSPLLKRLHQESDKLYANGLITLWKP